MFYLKLYLLPSIRQDFSEFVFQQSYHSAQNTNFLKLVFTG